MCSSQYYSVDNFFPIALSTLCRAVLYGVRFSYSNTHSFFSFFLFDRYAQALLRGHCVKEKRALHLRGCLAWEAWLVGNEKVEFVADCDFVQPFQKPRASSKRLVFRRLSLVM